jgi:serine/threonine protein kinase/CheY-like chemotaxis protein
VSNACVLVVDDSKINREVLARAIERAGYDVICCESGEKALDALDHHEPSIVLLDLVMEGMDGLETLQHLRMRKGLLELPVLMISSTKESPQVVKALDLGANDFLIKPVDLSILLAKIRHHLCLRPQSQSGGGSLETPVPSLTTGSQLSHYLLGPVLGEGGMGKVFRATDTILHRQVAIKVLHAQSNRDETLQRFSTEARAIARVQHPNVVTIYEIGQQPLPYISMEYIDGHCLDDASVELPLDWKTAVDWTSQVLGALAAVHSEGIVHRDLKPGNVMINREKRVKVMDFGLAKMSEANLGLTNSGSLLGTPQFMAPEQIDSSFGPVDARSDLFSAAGILFLLLTGTCPFPAKMLAQQLFSICGKEPENPMILNEKVPPQIAAVCLKGLRKRKDERYQSAESFLAALQECLSTV